MSDNDRTPLGLQIEAGLKEALAYAKSENDPSEYVVTTPEVSVPTLRKVLGDSQSQFAARIGVPVRTVQGWETRRKDLDAATRILLSMVAADPDVVRRTLGGGDTEARAGELEDA